MDGWIKLHRSIRSHWLYNTKKAKTRREAWEDILMLVNYESKKVLIRGQLYDCDRGQSLFSLENWAKEFNWSIQQVRTFFKLLENDKMITIEGMQYTTRLTVCNYESYQGLLTDEQQTNQQTANRPLTDEQQTANRPLTTTKERKEIKKEKKDKNIVAPPSFEEIEIYFKENGFDSILAKRFFDSYSVANWHDSKGNPVKNWKQKAINVWFKDENKPKQVQQSQIPQRKPTIR